jgi:hypothetical protein
MLEWRGHGQGRRTDAPIRDHGPGGTPTLPLVGPPFLASRDVDLAALVYELLDAHDDTARLVASHGCGAEWAAHTDYLRALQRRGREILARVGAP